MHTATVFAGVDWGSIIAKILIAIVILLITWVLARTVIWAFGKLAARVPALGDTNDDGHSLGATLGQIASLLVWLFGLIAVLQVFDLGEVLTPIQALLTGVMNFLPNLIGAIFVFVIGALLAKVARQLVETALGAVPFHRWLGSSRDGEEGSAGVPNIARTLALVLYALIMIVISIAALQILGISSISDPAQRMLQTIFDAVPNIVAAALMLGLGVVIARFAAGLLGDILEGLGTDRALREIDAVPEGGSAVPWITRVVQVAIVLFFAVMAAQLLNFPVITDVLARVLELGGKVVFGAAVIAAGFFVARLLGRVLSGTTAVIVRWATIVLFVAMGLTFMGIATEIIVLAFGSLVVGAALAAALAFGLGGRDAAGRVLERAQQRLDAPAPAAAGSGAGATPSDAAAPSSPSAASAVSSSGATFSAGPAPAGGPSTTASDSGPSSSAGATGTPATGGSSSVEAAIDPAGTPAAGGDDAPGDPTPPDLPPTETPPADPEGSDGAGSDTATAGSTTPETSSTQAPPTKELPAAKKAAAKKSTTRRAPRKRSGGTT
ncbi:mechanosensitive ion channel [Phycicoccus flavus]|uniref:Mechanosensitive ion channel n=1 Tax=Phycicoccus flavus TaxID=2502783 RepID=A0A8T6RAL0_9MICO|nr:mechanosensitive ion channel [Phycicoccus flavus]NHA69865.1 mechanosensitive ion channel [Phycicoccus flavus]